MEPSFIFSFISKLNAENFQIMANFISRFSILIILVSVMISSGNTAGPVANGCPSPNGKGNFPSPKSCNMFLECWGDARSGHQAAEMQCPPCSFGSPRCCNGMTCYNDAIKVCADCNNVDCSRCPAPNA